MIIKKSTTPSGPLLMLKNTLSKWIRKKIVWIPVFLLLFIGYSGFVFYYGANAHKIGLTSKIKHQWKRYLKLYLKLPKYYIKGLSIHPERISINIKFKDLQKLAYIRERALQGKRRSREYVNATIDYNGQSIPVKIRLKGDRRVHWEEKVKWSFRIKTKGDRTIFNMKWLNLHHPKTKNYIYEWLFHKVLSREGFIALRYKFIDVTLNGEDLGIYALEEHFDKQLVEYNRNREGPIIRFREDLGADLTTSAIAPFNSAKWSAPGYSKILEKAVSLLESFRKGESTISQVFDVKKLATYFAVNDLLGTHHGTAWKSIRFYYNPVTSRLEPIGSDGHYGTSGGETYISAELGVRPETGWYYDLYREWYRMIFNNKDTFDPVFYEEYGKALERLCQPSYLDRLFADINDELEYNLAIIYKEVLPFADHIYSFGPDVFVFPRDMLYERQLYIQRLMDKKKDLHAFYKPSSSQMTLELGSINKFPIEILGVSYKDSVLYSPSERVILYGKIPSTVPYYREIRFNLPKGFAWSDAMIGDLRVNYKVLGTTRKQSEGVYPWSHFDGTLISHDLIRKKPNVDKFDFISVDREAKRIFFKPGKWKLDRELVIPEGYKVAAREGLELDLVNRALILSYSPVFFTGTEETPVLIHSSDASGQGMVVINVDKGSVLKYTHFEGLSNPSQPGWELTGAVTFYQSPVQILNCQFSRNRSEDALNIIKSRFEIADTIFTEISADAFDGDFVSGKITGTSFSNCGNDAVDVSGSVIELDNVFVNRAEDKGLSAGENSTLTGSYIEIINSEIAVVSKDTSKVDISNVTINDSNVGFAVFRKKPEFDGGSASVSKLKMKNVNQRYLLETGSTLILKGDEMVPNEESVKNLLYGNVYGKSSK